MLEFNKVANSYVIKNKVINSVVGTYVCMIFLVLPLCYHKYYFDLTKFKYKVYYIAAIGTAILLLAVQLIFCGGIKKCKRIIFTVPDILALLFYTSILISTIFSRYRYEAFWGNEGNWMGLFFTTVIFATYWFIARGLKFQRWYLELFLVAGLLVSCLGIAHYFGIDILGFKKNLQEQQKNIFVSTIGNINQYTAYLAMPVAISCALFATSEKVKATIWYYACMVVFFVALILGISDNAYLTLGALFLLLPFYLFSKKAWIKRYYVIVVTFITVVWALKIFEYEKHGVMSMDSVFTAWGAERINVFVILVLWAFVTIMYLVDYIRIRTSKRLRFDLKEGRKLRYCWMVTISVMAVIFIGMLIDVNLFGDTERYGAIGGYLYFSDEWGSLRGWAWKAGIRSYREFSLFQKLFGYGPETFGIIMINQHWEEMRRTTQQTFLTVHNQYIQYLVTIGVLGVLAYLGMCITFIYWMVKKSGHNKKYVIPIAYALICYCAQDIVNFDTPLVAPILWTLVFVGISGCRRFNTNVNEEYGYEENETPDKDKQ